LTLYAELKRSEKRTVEQVLDMASGYVLDFSNRTIEEHFEDEFGIEFYSARFALNGESKAKRLRTVLETIPGPQAAAILKNLWDIRSTLPSYGDRVDPDIEASLQDKYFQIVLKLEGDRPGIDLTAITIFDDSNTLYALLQSIERDIRADAPEAAMDRLHLFCVTQFRHLLEVR
jgi:hypothetical protein